MKFDSHKKAIEIIDCCLQYFDENPTMGCNDVYYWELVEIVEKLLKK